MQRLWYLRILLHQNKNKKILICLKTNNKHIILRILKLRVKQNKIYLYIHFDWVSWVFRLSFICHNYTCHNIFAIRNTCHKLHLPWITFAKSYTCYNGYTCHNHTFYNYFCPNFLIFKKMKICLFFKCGKFSHENSHFYFSHCFITEQLTQVQLHIVSQWRTLWWPSRPQVRFMDAQNYKNVCRPVLDFC